MRDESFLCHSSPSMNRVLVAGGVGVFALALIGGCGGGGGSGKSHLHGDLSDATITVFGSPGKLFLSPADANAANGTTPLPSFSSSVTTENHWFRLEFPFDLDPTTILGTDPQLNPFSHLNGNITVTGENGEHLPGLALVNGKDAFGVDHALDVGFPHDIQSNGSDKNLGKGTFLYVADVNGSLASFATFGYGIGLNGVLTEIQNVANHDGGTLDTVRVVVDTVNQNSVDANWSFHVGSAGDARAPFLISVVSETRSPTDPSNPATISFDGSFIVRFSEPVVPKSVGHSALLEGFPFGGNLPNITTPPPPGGGIAPSPNCTIAATIFKADATGACPPTTKKVFIPFDCNPVNPNNLATYRLTPLVNLPPTVAPSDPNCPASPILDMTVRAQSKNVGFAALDFSGNLFDGADTDTPSNGIGNGVTSVTNFSVGPGPAVVNIPVSPEVIYWVPSTGDGIGAIDLNGQGFGTNTPGANSAIPGRAPIVTKPMNDFSGCDTNIGGLNLVDGIAYIAHPGNQVPFTDPCTGLPQRERAHNRFLYPVGLGSYPYGLQANATRGELWEAVNDPGNPGTPFPGVNEGSSGFETLCRDSNGDAILTGRTFSQVGSVTDMIVGEFLDRVYFDKFNLGATNSLHTSFFGGGGTQGRNVISDPPVPNPPPSRFWVGLPPLDTIIDQANPTSPAFVIEGEEVWTGVRFGGLAAGQTANAARTHSYMHLQPNPVNPNSADVLTFPGAIGANRAAFGSGPGGQSATAVYTFSSRQQIGNFLYATDASSRELHAINSNTMRVISSISLPDPTGLGMSPDMEYLYVTNFANDSVSVVGCDPTSPNFHREIARFSAGSGPRSIAVQPENEDIFVCNYLGNTVSIIDTKTLTARKTLDSLIEGPYDVEVSERQEQASAPHPFGWGCGLYFAYVANLTGNSVVVYESGPDGPQGIGINNIRGSLPLDNTAPQIIAPKGLCFSPFANPQGLVAGGVFIAHQDELGYGRVSHIQFTQQALYGTLPIQPPPGFFIPPGFTDRVFQVTSVWGDTDSSRLIGHIPSDVILADMATQAYQASPSGAPNAGGTSTPPRPESTGFINSKNHMRLVSSGASAALAPDRLYVCFEDSDSIQVLDPRQAGVVLKTIAGHGGGGTRRMSSFWRE